MTLPQSKTLSNAEWLPQSRQKTLAISVRRWVDRLRTRQRIRRDIDELMALDDRLLADIGLSRSDIKHGRIVQLSAHAGYRWRMP